jgi:hypothetical protein
VIFFEDYQRNQPIRWIAQAEIGNAIAEPANLVEIGLLCHSHDGNVSVGGGEIVSINIREIERVSRTGMERNDENEK